MPLFKKWSSEKRILLPVVVGDDLELRIYTGPEDMSISGIYGIAEPTGEIFTDYAAIEFIVVPGVAFDAKGNRLGRGKGYYDRLLPRIPSAYKAGICFPFQLVEEVPAESFDIRMDIIITINEDELSHHTTAAIMRQGVTKNLFLSAIKGGYQELGFSDHTPWKYHTDYISDIRMLPEELPGYVESIRSLQEKYKKSNQHKNRIGM